MEGKSLPAQIDKDGFFFDKRRV